MKSLAFPYSSKNRHTANTNSNTDPSILLSSSPYPQARQASPAIGASASKSSYAASTTSLTARATALFKHPLRVHSERSLASDHSASAPSPNGSASVGRSHEDLTSDSKLSLNPDSQLYLAVHPFAAMVAAPVPVVSSHDSDDEEACPVCLEPLSFSFRLPGEKPHIVPDCGHALHEVCDVSVPAHHHRSLEYSTFCRLALLLYTGHLQLRTGTEAFRARLTWAYVGCVEDR